MLTNIFKITCAKFYKTYGPITFVEEITKTILVCFYGTQCYILTPEYNTHAQRLRFSLLADTVRLINSHIIIIIIIIIHSQFVLLARLQATLLKSL